MSIRGRNKTDFPSHSFARFDDWIAVWNTISAQNPAMFQGFLPLLDCCIHLI